MGGFVLFLGQLVIRMPLPVDEQTLLVTPTVGLAIHGLRLQHRSRVLWIDAICINQADIYERNNQIQTCVHDTATLVE
jgi:hypothetical protein